MRLRIDLIVVFLGISLSLSHLFYLLLDPSHRLHACNIFYIELQ